MNMLLSCVPVLLAALMSGTTHAFCVSIGKPPKRNMQSLPSRMPAWCRVSRISPLTSCIGGPLTAGMLHVAGSSPLQNVEMDKKTRRADVKLVQKNLGVDVYQRSKILIVYPHDRFIKCRSQCDHQTAAVQECSIHPSWT